MATNPNGVVYARGYTFNAQQKQGPRRWPGTSWPSLRKAVSAVSPWTGRTISNVAWQQDTDGDSVILPNGTNLVSEGIYGTEYQMVNYTSGAGWRRLP